MVDLLTPLPDVPDHKLHWAFKLLVVEDKYAPARDMLRKVWAEFPNPDDHFIREFQTAGFDARVWELVLAAVGQFGPYKVTRPHEAPDFLFERDGFGVWIEATTANPSGRSPQEVAEPVDRLEARFHEMNNIVPIRLGSSLYSKLKKSYWQQAHVAGRPFVIAIEDFAEDAPIRTSDTPLFKYLYGMDQKVVSLPGEPVEIENVKIAAHKHYNKEIWNQVLRTAGGCILVEPAAVQAAIDAALPRRAPQAENIEQAIDHVPNSPLAFELVEIVVVDENGHLVGPCRPENSTMEIV